MALNYVTLTCDLYDGQGNPVTSGEALFTPSVQLTDTSDHQLITLAPVPCVFHSAGTPAVKLLATDNGAPLPNGWAWTVSFAGVAGNPASFSFFLPFASGASQYLSAQAPVSSVVTMQAYMPLPSGTATSGYVPIATGSGEGSAWGSVMLNPMTTLGDLIYENATPAAARLAGDTSNTRKFLRTQASAGVAQAPAWDTIAAGDVPTLNQNTTGTAANVTGTVAIGNGGTGQATQQAAIDALAGAVTSGLVLRGNGTHAVMAAIQAGDVPDLAYVDTVTAVDTSITVTGATDTPALSSVPALIAQRMFAA